MVTKLPDEEKIKLCPTNYLMNSWMLIKEKVLQLKKEKIHIKWLSQTRLLLITGGNYESNSHIRQV